MLAEKFAPLFPIDLVEKDFNYTVSSAKKGGQIIPLAEVTMAVFQRAIEEGFGEDNITGVIQLYG